MTGKHPFPLRVAGVDVGSNGIRFLAAEFSGPDQCRLLASERVALRLGASVFRGQKINRRGMTDAVAALGRFQGQVRRLGIEHVRAVATSAVRDSANGGELARRVADRWKLNLEVISGSEEVRLVWQAVKRQIPLARGPWLIANLGGGSVEIALADGLGLAWSESHTLGAVRLLQEFSGVAPTGRDYGALLGDYIKTMQLRQPLPRGLAGLVLTGGNIEVLAKIGRTRLVQGAQVMAAAELRRLCQELVRLTPAGRRRSLGLKLDRADVILPAALVYEQIAALARQTSFWIPGVGTKEGLLLDLAERLTAGSDHDTRQEDQTREAAVRLGRRYRFDEPHGVQVARLAVSLFDQLQGMHGLGESDRRLLQAAGVLHDVGMFISYKKHHKHSLYVIANSELPGFTPAEMLLVANIARYHRKKGPEPDHEYFRRLAKPDQARVRKLASLLRIADALDREHIQAVRRLKAVRRPGRVELQVEGKGLGLEKWALARKAEMFRETYKVHCVLA